MPLDPFKVQYSAKDISEEFLDIYKYLTRDDHEEPAPLWVLQTVVAQAEHWADIARLNGEALV